MREELYRKIAKQIRFISNLTRPSELETTIPPNPHPHATKKFRLLLNAREGAKADQLFFKIAAEFYERFQKEGVIDERCKRVSWRGKFAKDFLISNNNSLQDFIENIDNALALTVDEQRLIGETVKLVEEASSKAKRVAGTANEPIEKFLYHSEN